MQVLLGFPRVPVISEPRWAWLDPGRVAIVLPRAELKRDEEHAARDTAHTMCLFEGTYPRES
jgi:hypothetical protein